MGEVYAGRYELVDHLGGGGSGAVWRAWDHRHGRYLAVKLLRQRDAGAMMRFVREQSLRVAHPHVLPPTGFAADDDVVLLTMDLMAGGPLSALVAEVGPLPVPHAVLLLDQLLDALVDVHAASLVHRDVKPANVLLDAVGVGRPLLRLADFGIAVSLGEPRLTELGLVIGTPAYLPPEAAQGAEPHPRQDLYAAGAVGWYLLRGVHPRPDMPAAVDALAGQLPSPLHAVWARLLAPEPGYRYQLATEARAELAAAVGASGLSDAVASIGTPSAPPDLALIRVPDRLGPLPPGWTSNGPEASASRPPVGVTRTRRPAYELPTDPGSDPRVAPTVAFGANPTVVEPAPPVRPLPPTPPPWSPPPGGPRQPASPGWAPSAPHPPGLPRTVVPPGAPGSPAPGPADGRRSGIPTGTLVRLGIATAFLVLALVLFALALLGP